MLVWIILCSKIQNKSYPSESSRNQKSIRSDGFKGAIEDKLFISDFSEQKISEIDRNVSRQSYFFKKNDRT